MDYGYLEWQSGEIYPCSCTQKRNALKQHEQDLKSSIIQAEERLEELKDALYKVQLELDES